MNPDNNETTPEPIGVPLAIAAAAFFYPIFGVWAVMLSWLFDGDVQVGSDPFLRLRAFLMGTGMAVVYGCVLFAVILIVSFPIEWAVRAVQRSLEREWSEPRHGAHTGAWVAFLGTTFIGLAIKSYSYDIDAHSLSAIVAFLLLGPGLATPLLQYAGAWSQWRTKAAMSTRRWTFGIRHVLVITAWIAGALALLKVLNLLSRDFLAYFVGWLVYQYATMELVLRFCDWRGRRFLKRRGGDGGGEGDVDGKRGA